MPKGVEHNFQAGSKASHFRVKVPLMPKGVEHVNIIKGSQPPFR